MTARKDFPVFDCDSHVVEPPAIWDEYVPSRSRAWIKTQFRVPPAAQRKLLGENARRLYGIEPVMAIAERIEEYAPAILPW